MTIPRTNRTLDVRKREVLDTTGKRSTHHHTLDLTILMERDDGFHGPVSNKRVGRRGIDDGRWNVVDLKNDVDLVVPAVVLHIDGVSSASLNLGRHAPNRSVACTERHARRQPWYDAELVRPCGDRWLNVDRGSVSCEVEHVV